MRLIHPRLLGYFAAASLFLGCLALCAHGQSSTASAQPTSGSTEGVTTLHTRSNLVVIDVVVTDSKHNPVHGLKESDFTLLENNKEQRIRNFEEHSAALDAEKFTPGPKLPDGLFTNRAPAPTGGPVNVLLLDYLNTPLSAQPYARKQLLEFLDKTPPGTRIAIFGLTEKLDMLQGFTTDPSVLKAALNVKTGGAAKASDILLDSTNGGSMTDTNLSDNLLGGQTVADGGFITQEMIDDIQRFQALQTSFTQDLRAQYTLAGFQLLARYLVGIPGRKNVIWFSAGFPLNVDPNVNEADPNDSVVRNDDQIRETDNLLTRAQIAVYPVDARGVFTDPGNDVSQHITSITSNSGSQAADEQLQFMQQTSQEHESMFAMAEDTGGEAFVNTNNLTQAVTKAVEDGSNYYTLTYTPANLEWDGRFRAVKVKLEQPGVKLSYREGYYADDPNDRSKLVAGHAAMASGPASTMVTAMMHGGPDPAEILFKVRIRPAAAPPEDAPLKNNRANPDPKVKIVGPFKEYGVDLVPDPHAVSCPITPEGTHRCALEVNTYVYDREGELLITAHNAVSQAMSTADYAKLQSSGMAFHQEVSVPVKGQYYLRTAIHDLNSDRIGAVEVPVAAVLKLDPLKPLIAADAPAAGAGTPASPATSTVPATAGVSPQ